MKYLNKPDYILIATTFWLVIIGLLMILSSSFKFELLNRQFISLIIGIFSFYAGLMLNYHVYRRWAIPLAVLTFLLLLLTYIPGIGITAGGASRWLNFGIIVFQPSEFAKMTIILLLAMVLENKKETIKSFWQGLVPIILVVGLIMGLILKQPDLGSTMLIALVVGLMLLVGGAQIWQLLILSAIGFRAVVWYIQTNPYQMDRIASFLDPWKHYLGVGFHTVQSLMAVGSGGVFGLGLSYSRQKFSYLPNAYTDYIFAIICEEMGFIGAIFVLTLFLVFAFRGLRIARLAPDRFGLLVALGITAWIVFEAFINIAVVLGMLPPTGIPLVFVSFGGTSLIISLFGVGVLANISRQVV